MDFKKNTTLIEEWWYKIETREIPICFLGLWVIIGAYISKHASVFYFKRQKYIIYIRKVNITINNFLINLEVFTCVNQSFLKKLIQFIIKFRSTMPEFLRRILRKEWEFQRSRKITVDELYDSRECSSWLCPQEGLKDPPSSLRHRTERGCFLWARSHRCFMGISIVNTDDMISE